MCPGCDVGEDCRGVCAAVAGASCEVVRTEVAAVLLREVADCYALGEVRPAFAATVLASVTSSGSAVDRLGLPKAWLARLGRPPSITKPVEGALYTAGAVRACVACANLLQRADGEPPCNCERLRVALCNAVCLPDCEARRGSDCTCGLGAGLEESLLAGEEPQTAIESALSWWLQRADARAQLWKTAAKSWYRGRAYEVWAQEVEGLVDRVGHEGDCAAERWDRAPGPCNCAKRELKQRLLEDGPPERAKRTEAPSRAEEFQLRVQGERARQDAKWGTVPSGLVLMAVVLGEEVGEVHKAILEEATGDDIIAHVEAELVQVAAVCQKMFERECKPQMKSITHGGVR